MTRICIKCGETKEEMLFPKNKNKCKQCCCLYSKSWRESNLKKGKDQSEVLREKENKKAWREANREKVEAYKKAWCEANREKLEAYKKAWYKANREKHIAICQAWRKDNKEKILHYRANRFFKRSYDISSSEIPTELLELKSKQIELLRLIKTKKEALNG
jgi:hypothetical protein